MGKVIVEREFSLNVGGTVLPIPCFFPAISSIKTNLPPLEYLRVLVAVNHPLFLISAYDIHHASPEDHTAIEDLLARSYTKNRIILMDSGNYESYWKRDDAWTRDHFAAIIETISFGILLRQPVSSNLRRCRC